jgi:putative DNA primase/helicase
MATDPFAPIGRGPKKRRDDDEFKPVCPPRIPQCTEILHGKLGLSSAVWEYYERSGEFSGLVCRFETIEDDGKAGKTFLPRRYGTLNGSPPKWHWKGWRAGRPPLYNLRELLSRPDATVIIVEGEKPADATAKRFLDYVAVSPMNGAKSPHKSDWGPVAGHNAIIWGDNDEPGRSFAQAVAKLATAAGASSVAVVAVPQDWPKGWDLADPMPEGVGTEALSALLANAVPFVPPPAPDPDVTPKRATQATQLIELAERTALFHTTDAIGYAYLQINGHRETWAIRSSSFKRWLGHAFYDETRGAPNGEAKNAALEVIHAKALYEGPEHSVFVRVAEAGGKIYIDLADDQWRAIEVDAEGWRICREPPVRFRRSPGMRQLPIPVGHGSIDELKPFVNVADQDDFVLAVAWVLAALRPRGPYPILAVGGEAGAAKTTLIRVLRSLIDPAVPALRRPPHNERDIFIGASNSHVVAYDNLSRLVAWLSDTLCTLATGGGAGTRKLHTDDEEAIFDTMKPVALSAVEGVVTRSDAADRSIHLILPNISKESRQTEEEFWTGFEQARPRILGTLLEGVACGLREYSGTKLARKPRMADFARWSTACEQAFWPSGRFMTAYEGNRQDAVETLIEDDPVARTLRDFMQQSAEWEGSQESLFKALGELAGQKITDGEGWPKTPQGRTGRLRRIAPPLREFGIDIKRGERSKRSRRLIIKNTGAHFDPTTTSSSSPDVSSDSTLAHPLKSSGQTRHPRHTRHLSSDFNDLDGDVLSRGNSEHVTRTDVTSSADEGLGEKHVTPNQSELNERGEETGDVFSGGQGNTSSPTHSNQRKGD